MATRVLFGAEQRGSAFYYLMSEAMRESEVGGSWGYQANAAQGHQTNPVVFACMSQIMTAASSLRLGLAYEGEALDLLNLPPNYAPLGKLLKRPNPNQAQDEWIETGFLHWHLGGCCHVRGLGLGQEELTPGYVRTKTAPELYWLRPDQVKCLHSGMMMTGYEYRPDDGPMVKLTPDEVLTIRFPGPKDDYSGMSPLGPVERTIRAQNKAITWNAALFDNSAIPPNAIEVDGLEKLDKDERERVRQEFQREWAGARNAGKSIVKGVGMKVTPLATTPKDLDWLNGDTAMMRKICAALGVPSILVGDPVQGTYANYKEARRAFYQETVLPRTQHMIGELNAWLLPKYGEGIEITISYEHIDALRDDETVKVTTRRQSDWLSVNEQRAEDGLEPYGDPDDPENEANIPRALRAQTNPFAGTPLDTQKASSRELLMEPLPFREASMGH